MPQGTSRNQMMTPQDLDQMLKNLENMARSGNRDVPHDLARELGMGVAFSPCYLNLTKGNGAERCSAGENTLGLHGNAILSRYPLSGLRVHSLTNGRDKLSGPERRIGRQRGITADVALPGLPLSSAGRSRSSTRMASATSILMPLVLRRTIAIRRASAVEIRFSTLSAA